MSENQNQPADATELRRREERYRNLFENTEVGMYRSKLDGSAVPTANQKLAEILGVSREEIMSNPAFIHWENPVDREEMTRRLKEDGAILDYEVRLIAKNGEIKTCLVSGKVFHDEGIFEGSLVDITERKRAEEALAESLERFRRLIESLPQLVWTCQGDGPCDYLSPQWVEYTGIPAAEQLGFAWLDRLHPDDRERAVAAWNEAIEQNKPFDVEFRIRRRDGVFRWFKTRALAFRDGQGRIVKWFGTNTDIEDQKLAQKELELRHRIASIFLSVPDDEMYAEVLKVVLDVAQSQFGVFGYIDEEGALVVPSMTRHIWEECQVPEKDIVFPREKWGDSIWPTAIQQKKLLFSNSSSDRVPKGHVPITRNITVPIVHEGEVVGLLQVANKDTDYTPSDIATIEILRDLVAPILGARLARDRLEKERRRREEEIVTLNKELDQRVVARTVELTAANRELEAFDYSVSHDLRAPLRGIDGFSKALLDDYRDKLDDTAKDYINRVRAGTQRMGMIIDDLLKLSRLTRAEMHLRRLDLSELGRKIAAELQRDEPGRRVDFEISPDLTALGDRALLAAALENLLRNAWKFTVHREHARIELGATEQDGERIYYVRDNGAGFDMAYSDKLFGAFERLHDTTEFPGTGIGLAIVQRAISRQGGRIWAEGEVDKGATFYFTLPSGPVKTNGGGLSNEAREHHPAGRGQPRRRGPDHPRARAAQHRQRAGSRAQWCRGPGLPLRHRGGRRTRPQRNAGVGVARPRAAKARRAGGLEADARE